MCGAAGQTAAPPMQAFGLQAAPADTSQNPALQEMLEEFRRSQEAKELPYQSWTLTVHRYLGYTILAAAATQVVLGIITYNEEKKGETPGTRTAHKYLGYGTAGVSLAQSGLGAVNLWKLRDKESGRNKRLLHMGLSAAATAGFITAAAMAYNSRQSIEEGTAGNKTFDDLYSNHRTVGIVSGASVLLTTIVIEW